MSTRIMVTAMIRGFVVAFEGRGTRFGPGLNGRYRGIYRRPVWPSADARENAALERYVFDLVDDDGLIADRHVASALASELRQFGRAYEVMYCELVSAGVTPPPPGNFPLLGYDVSPIGGEYQSRLGCFPNDPRLLHFLDLLNANGLFDNVSTGLEFAAKYTDLQLPEWDVPHGVFSIRLAD